MRTSLLIILFVIASCSDGSHSGHEGAKSDVVSEHKVETYYTCSMHPKVREDGPGKCPICHMNLTKVEVDDSDYPAPVEEKVLYQCKDLPDITSEVQEVCPIDGTQMVRVVKEKSFEVVAKVKLRKAQLSHFRADLFEVTSMKMNKSIRLLGTVAKSEDRESSIPARVSGRVERVYVKSTGSFVKEGSPVVDIYSPTLISGGEEYLLARKSLSSNKSKVYRDLYLQTVERLKQWGIQDFQLEKWFSKGSVPRNITIHSPATGIVIKRNAIKGKYFKRGQNFFELSDLSSVWIEMDVYEQDSALVSVGQKVEVDFSALPGEKHVGEIDFVSPVIDTKSRTMKVRATVLNKSGRLKPGMIANAKLMIEFPNRVLVVPRSAVIDTGKRKVVWIQIDQRRYQAKEVKVGVESEGYIEVKQGLMEGEKVVFEGNFLLDAQAQLFGGYETKSAGHKH